MEQDPRDQELLNEIRDDEEEEEDISEVLNQKNLSDDEMDRLFTDEEMTPSDMAEGY